MKQQAILYPNYEVISSIYRQHVIVEDMDLSAYFIVIFYTCTAIMAWSRFSLEKLQTWIWIWIILTLSHYSCSLCGSVCINCDLQHLVSALSAKLREEELGQQPWACCCHRFTAFEWFSPLPHVCVVFLLSVSFSVVPPLCSPFCFDLCGLRDDNNLLL